MTFSGSCQSQFQSSPGSEAGCNPATVWTVNHNLGFQSSPGSEAGCNRPGLPRPPCAGDVPILTRLGSRVQRSETKELAASLAKFQSSPGSEAGCNTGARGQPPLPIPVPILTRLGSRVQPLQTPIRESGRSSFQSSPGSEAGCNHKGGRCTGTSGSSNPHPARKPGATTRATRACSQRSTFQSSPGSEAGCNFLIFGSQVDAGVFQSSPGSEAGCNHSGSPGFPLSACSNPHPARKPGATGCLARVRCEMDTGSNPHPARKPGATVSPCRRPLWNRCSNPHPARKPGATRESVIYRRSPLLVPILTRLGSRVQPHGRRGTRRGFHSSNPHPARKPGATSAVNARHPPERSVPILTRLGSRVQPTGRDKEKS